MGRRSIWPRDNGKIRAHSAPVPPTRVRTVWLSSTTARKEGVGQRRERGAQRCIGLSGGPHVREAGGLEGRAARSRIVAKDSDDPVTEAALCGAARRQRRESSPPAMVASRGQLTLWRGRAKKAEALCAFNAIPGNADEVAEGADAFPPYALLTEGRRAVVRCRMLKAAPILARRRPHIVGHAARPLRARATVETLSFRVETR